MTSKIALISGCSSGLGLEMLQVFLKNGWQVIAITRNKASIHIEHPNLITISLDLSKSSAQDIKDYIAPHLSKGLDLLINNAGFALVGAFETLGEIEIREQMEVNFFSHLFITKACLEALRKRKGKIFTLSSVFGLMGCPYHTLYCASKFALEGFSEALHYEVHNQGIQCTVIEPGRYHTQFGNNMKIVEPSLSHQENYAKSYQGFMRLKQKLKAKKANNTLAFANKIFQLTQQEKTPLRVPIDLDSKIPFLIRKYLPTALFSWLQYKLFAKHFDFKHV